MDTVYSKTKTMICMLIFRSAKVLMPFSNGMCKFEPSCSSYAVEAVKVLPLYRALPKIVYRLIRCNPFSVGGYDPVKRERNS